MEEEIIRDKVELKKKFKKVIKYINENQINLKREVRENLYLLTIMWNIDKDNKSIKETPFYLKMKQYQQYKW